MARLAHCMLRVGDLDRSLTFYCDHIGLKLLRREEYPDGRFTLAFLGDEAAEPQCLLELTHNWDTSCYVMGSAFGHVAFAVEKVEETCARLEEKGIKILRAAGPMKHTSPQRVEAEIFAFVEDPDSYRVELVGR